MLRAAFLIACVCVCACAVPIELSNFDNHVTLRDNEYDIYWNISGNSIVLALGVVTNGWIGFAIGEPTSGSMPGADYVTGWVDDDTLEASVQDRFALDYVMPSIDSCQDWSLVASDQSDGKTTLVVTRLLQTTDHQDRSIVAGPMRVLYAYGASDAFGYHGTSRSMTSVEFIPIDRPVQSEVNAGAVVYTHDLLMNAAQVPTLETAYFCQTFQLPDIQDGQIIRIDPIIEINPSAPDLVHHFIAYACYLNESNWNTHPYPQRCDGMSAECSTMFYGWAPGVDSLVLPKEAGVRIGREQPHAFRYFILEVHYNNVNHYSGLIDNSGIRVHYTTDITRPNDAGVLILGDIFLDFPSLEPHQKSIAFETECPSACTSKFPHDINVFLDSLHMHQTGSQVWNTHWRNDSMVVENRVDFWDFGLQVTAPVNYTLRRGDSMHLHCLYNTMKRTSPVIFGPASSDEMCFNFLMYYPIMQTDFGIFSACGNVKADESQVTACGAFNDPNFVVTPLIANPLHPDPSGTGDITFGRPCGKVPTSSPVSSSANPRHNLAVIFYIMSALLTILVK